MLPFSRQLNLLMEVSRECDSEERKGAMGPPGMSSLTFVGARPLGKDLIYEMNRLGSECRHRVIYYHTILNQSISQCWLTSAMSRIPQQCRFCKFNPDEMTVSSE